MADDVFGTYSGGSSNPLFRSASLFGGQFNVGDRTWTFRFRNDLTLPILAPGIGFAPFV